MAILLKQVRSYESLKKKKKEKKVRSYEIENLFVESVLKYACTFKKIWKCEKIFFLKIKF